MTNKKTIAVDIDDVLAANAAGFVKFSNERWGTNLTPADYQEHWGELWKIDQLDEVQRRSDELHSSGVIGTYAHDESAVAVLEHLRKKYRLVIVTSRRRMIEKETFAWIDSYFRGIFDEVHFAGFWDKTTTESIAMTKADICKQIGADYLIDDQCKHVEAAAGAGLKAVLFGNYGWNQMSPLPKGVVRCSTWSEVQDFFDAES